MYNLGCYYISGSPELGLGVPKDSDSEKALELWQRASCLGCAEAHYNIGITQFHGRDLRQAIHYYELAAMGGHELARHNVGKYEEVMTRNKKRALKHFMIAVTSSLWIVSRNYTWTGMQQKMTICNGFTSTIICKRD